MNRGANTCACDSKMLPRLRLLDEEEVDVLRAMRTLHMPKYHLSMRRIVANKRLVRPPPPASRPESTAFHGHDSIERERERQVIDSPPKPLERDTNGKCLDQATTRAPEHAEARSAQRLVVKDSSTNTSVDLEKETLLRDQALAQKAAQLVETETTLLATEQASTMRETTLRASIVELQEQLREAEARACRAEATVLDLSTRLVDTEQTQAAASTQTVWSEQQAEAPSSRSVLEAAHQAEVAKLTATNGALETTMATMARDLETLTQQCRETEARLALETTRGDTSEAIAADLADALERARKTHDALAVQLSDDVKDSNDRAEHAETCRRHLETQVTELRANVEKVYNKCIEKDETIQQLHQSLVARQSDLDALRGQAAKDQARQDQMLAQQQDVYARQLDASIGQVEVEFRKEYARAVQTIQSLQRRGQARVERLQQMQDAYRQSLAREAAAKAEVAKLQARFADELQHVGGNEARQRETLQAALDAERAKCHDLEERWRDEQRTSAQVAVLRAERDAQRLETDRLCHELSLRDEEAAQWEKRRDELQAACKVKDVMLADHVRQIQELTHARQRMEAQVTDERLEYQAHVDDLEAALDESLEKAAHEQVKHETLATKVTALEQEIEAQAGHATVLRTEVAQKVAALEVLEHEVQRMRLVLETQADRFRTQLERATELHRQETERLCASAEEERGQELQRWEAQRQELVRRIEDVSTQRQHEAKARAAAHVAFESERRKTARHDREMRCLLAALDRERQAKKTQLRQIKALFEQLQREGP